MDPNVDTIPPPPAGFELQDSALPPPPPGFVMQGDAPTEESKAWYQKPLYKTLIPKSVREGVSNAVSGAATSIANSPIVKETLNSPYASLATFPFRAVDYLINKPIDYLAGKPAGALAGKAAETIAPYSLPVLTGLENKPTPEESAAFGKRVGESIRQTVNTAAPFFLPSLATRAASGIKSFSGSAAAETEAAAAAAKTATDEARIGNELTARQEFTQKQGMGAQENAAKTAREYNAQQSANEAQQMKAQEGMASAAEQERQARLDLVARQTSQPMAGAPEVQSAAAGVFPAPVSTGEAGGVYKKQYTQLRAASSKEANRLYTAANETGGDVAYDRPNLNAAVDQLAEESGTLKSFLSNRANRAARELQNRAALPTRTLEGGRAFDPTAVERDTYNRLTPIFQAQETRGSVPIDVWREVLGDKGEAATIGDMIIDRQKIRAAGRAAGTTGRLNEARQLGILEKGLTKDIEAASPAAKESITTADTYYKTEHAPYFVPGSPAYKAAKKSDEAITNHFLRQAAPGKEGDAIAKAENFNSLITDPQSRAQVGRSLIDGTVQRSIDKTTGQFSNDKFTSGWLSYPDRVREIAVGPRAKTQIDNIVSMMQQGKEGKAAIGEAQGALSEAEKASKLAAKQVSATATAEPTVDLKGAVQQVERTSKESAAIDKKITDRSDEQILQSKSPSEVEKFTNYYKRRGLFWGSVLMLEGATSGNMARVLAGGQIAITGKVLSALMGSSAGRNLLTGAMSAGRLGVKAGVVAAQMNGVIRQAQGGDVFQ